MARAGIIRRKAWELKDAGKLAEAEQQCNQLLRTDPNDSDANRLMGLIYLQANQPAQAVAFLEKAVTLSPNDAAVLLDLGRAYEVSGRFAEAWNFYRGARKSAPNHPNILGTVAGFLVRTEQVDAALTLCREAISSGWKDASTLVQLGSIFSRRLQFVEAEEVFRQALVWAPKDVTALTGRGFALLSVHRFNEAADSFKAAAILAPSHQAASMGLASSQGSIALLSGRWSEAAENFSRSIGIQNQIAEETAPPPISLVSEMKAPLTIHRVLYLEIELKAREFEARVLLAAHAAAMGFDVVVGQKTILDKLGYDRLPAGLILFKTMNKIDGFKMRRAAKHGHMVAVLDEEAFGGCGQRPLWLRLHTDPTATECTELIVAQGREYCELLTSIFPELVKRISILGNPRVDFYRPEFRKRIPERKAPAHILICSMSQTTNSRTIIFDAIIAQYFDRISPTETFARELAPALKHYIEYEVSIMPQLQAAVTAVSEAFPETPIKFRPHPLERSALWEQAFAALDNVTVANDGPLTDALVNAKALVYVAGCATGCEGHFQGVPLVRFDGDGRVSDPGNWISNNLGFPAKSPEDVVASLHRIDAGENTRDSDTAALSKSFHSDGERLVSAGFVEGISKVIEPHLRPESSALAKLRALATPELQKIVQREFDELKFPTTTLAEVKELTEHLAQIAKISVPTIETIAQNVFLFSPGKD